VTPAPELVLRRAGPADAAAIRELTRQAYAKWVPLIGREPTPATADYDRVVREDPVDLLLRDGEPEALAWTVPHPYHLLLESLAVAPAHQGHGYGRYLLAHAERFAAGRGLPLVRLYTNRVFAANIALYLRAGYAVDREEPFWGGVKVHMNKRVGPAASPSPTDPPTPAWLPARRTRRRRRGASRSAPAGARPRGPGSRRRTARSRRRRRT
jgi:GNAT superfamily N-acetyltransferase